MIGTGAPIDGWNERARRLKRLQHWRYDPARLVLVHSHPHSYDYEVDPELCTTAAQALDRIAQVAGKTWATSECVGELVTALNLLLELQANLCPFGQARRADAAAILRARHDELGLLRAPAPARR